MPTRDNVLSLIKTRIPEIFTEAQKPNAVLRKYSINLTELQFPCCLKTPAKKGQPQDIDYEGEELFTKEVLRNINKILSIKKKEAHADRIVRFIASFLQYMQEYDSSLKEVEVTDSKSVSEKSSSSSSSSEEESEDDREKEPTIFIEEECDEEQGEEFETVCTRFVENLLRHLLAGFNAKNVNVRHRCCQIIALSISSMGEIDEDLYQDLKIALFERIKDKDSSVRIQAATALCRLQNADIDVDPTDGKTILQKLMWILQNDSNAEIRRVILFNIDPNQDTLPYIVERARDVDPINRRVVYLKPLSDLQDFRLLSFQQRSNVLKWGLNDRDPLVRKAVGKMLSTKWIKQASNNLIEFLERLEILKSGVADIAESVLNAFFAERMDIIKEITFDAEFWKHLTPESIFLAKVFINFLQTKNHLDERLEDVLPEVTDHANNLEYYWEMYQSASDEDKPEYEFIISQLLETCMCLDYADEVGRRKVFELLRSILKSFDIISDHLTRIIRLFRLISSDERDFTRTMIEIISDIQELFNPFEGLEESSAKKIRLDDGGSSSPERTNALSDTTDNDIRFKCLSICRSMLENSQESFNKNSNLYGLLNDLIVPAVQNADTNLRGIGLHCLGLCCTLDRELAQHNISLFIHCIKCGHDELKIRALMILFDLIMTYGLQTVTAHLEDDDELKEVLEYCLDDSNDEVQALAAEGVSKLMLTQRLKDESLLRLLVLLYFLPVADETNLKVQQCLSYFFPAYSFSSLENQKNMAAVTLDVLNEVCSMHSDLKPYETMTTPIQIAGMLAYWTDPRKLAQLHIENLYDEIDMSTPGLLAVLALESALESEGYKRKTMLHFVLKSYLDKANRTELERIRDLIIHINTTQPIKEVMTRNAYSTLLSKIEENLMTE